MCGGYGGGICGGCGGVAVCWVCVSGVHAGRSSCNHTYGTRVHVPVLGHRPLLYSLEAGSLTGPGAKVGQLQATSIPLPPLCLLLELPSCVFTPHSPAGTEPWNLGPRVHTSGCRTLRGSPWPTDIPSIRTNTHAHSVSDPASSWFQLQAWISEHVLSGS